MIIMNTQLVRADVTYNLTINKKALTLGWVITPSNGQVGGSQTIQAEITGGLVTGGVSAPSISYSIDGPAATVTGTIKVCCYKC